MIVDSTYYLFILGGLAGLVIGILRNPRERERARARVERMQRELNAQLKAAERYRERLRALDAPMVQLMHSLVSRATSRKVVALRGHVESIECALVAVLDRSGQSTAAFRSEYLNLMRTPHFLVDPATGRRQWQDRAEDILEEIGRDIILAWNEVASSGSASAASHAAVMHAVEEAMISVGTRAGLHAPRGRTVVAR